MNEIRLSDIFGQLPGLPAGTQYGVSVPMGYGYDPSWGRLPPLGPALRGSILGGPGPPQLQLKSTEVPQPGLMFRLQVPF